MSTLDTIAPSSPQQRREMTLPTSEAEQLRIYRSALEIQTDLLTSAVFLQRTSGGTFLVKALLQKILQTVVTLTDAKESSLFLLDPDGKVIESILARGPVIQELKQAIIGKVLDRGLAGWVYRQRQIGLITDTLHDDRWLQLPSQPYEVRSVLGLPLLRGNRVLAIMTLMHPQPHHFDRCVVNALQLNLAGMALLIESVQLHSQTP